jgi:biopolymer transport protein ExbD/biopolymer transport protein TolR
MPGRRRRERFPLNADVNVVSLIDVMLLLLVIFMITAPMMQGGVDLTLPKAEAKPLQSKSGLVVSINRDGEIRLGEEKMTLGEFRVAFKSQAANRAKDGVYLRADRGVNYGLVVQLLAIMNAAGVGQIGLVTEPEDIR